MAEDIMDAEVVEETGLAVRADAPVSLFGTTDPDEVVDKAAKHATALARVINERNLYSKIQGRDHVQVEGWQLLGSMTGVFAVVTETKPIVDSEGKNGWEARCEARTMNGNVIGAADAMCTRSESTWSKRDDYAIRSMAQTRATSKALKGPLGFIVKLAGYSSTPAEEIPHDDDWTAPSSGPACLTCGSPVWDNSKDPDRGKRPKWKCKDKNCGWASWDDDPFTQDVQTDSAPPSTTSAEPHPSEPGVGSAESALPEAEPNGEDSPTRVVESSPSPSAHESISRIAGYIDGHDGRAKVIKAKVARFCLTQDPPVESPDAWENAPSSVLEAVAAELVRA